MKMQKCVCYVFKEIFKNKDIKDKKCCKVTDEYIVQVNTDVLHIVYVI